jgi:hypothetical protein
MPKLNDVIFSLIYLTRMNKKTRLAFISIELRINSLLIWRIQTQIFGLKIVKSDLSALSVNYGYVTLLINSNKSYY